MDAGEAVEVVVVLMEVLVETGLMHHALDAQQAVAVVVL
jgi:hypothetical protein